MADMDGDADSDAARDGAGERHQHHHSGGLSDQGGAVAGGDDVGPTRDGDAGAIAHALDAWYTALGRQFGPLSRPQRRMLHTMATSGGDGLRMSDLAQRLGLTAAGATRMVDLLEGLGYARRFRAPGEDQRQVYVAATAAGAAALAEADRAFEERVGRSLAPLTPEERARLGELLRRVAALGSGGQ